MTRRVCLYLVGSLVLLSLAGCGRGFFQTAQREAWRHEAEVACLKSGQLKEGTELVRIKPISGPGVCGADFPLKVAALGGNNSSALGFASDLRPPGDIPRGSQPRWPVRPEPSSYPAPAAYPAAPAPRPAVVSSYPAYPAAAERAPAAAPGGPMSLNAPGVVQEDNVVEAPAAVAPPLRQAMPAPARYDAPRSYEPPPRLGPARGSPVAAIGPVEVKPNPTLACPIVSMLDRWITDSIQPAALRWFGSPVAEIRQISAYSCRGMNGNPNARISEHAFGNALDISAFVLADGRRISVQNGWKGMPEEQGFLRDVQAAACQYFTTVLAPGSNVYHYNHIHVDLMRRSSGRAICRPGAVSGEEVAARAAGRNPFANLNRGGVTGSIGKNKRSAYAHEDESEIDTQ